MTQLSKPASGRVPIRSSVTELPSPAAIWICDIWGVLHNGVSAFPAAVAACRRNRDAGGTVLLLSNAPRPASVVEAHLARLGVPRECYDMIVTSGDLTRRWIIAHGDRPLHHLGPAKDKGLFEALPVTFAPLEAAELVICTGLLDDDNETPDDYEVTLRFAAERGLRMICANPDLTVERGSAILYCAGALAARYAELGGHVTYAGKPHPPVYDMAFEAVAALRGRAPERDEMIAIGDGIRTDIAGAAAVGIRSVFIASAVHVKAPLTPALLDDLFPAGAPTPIAALAALA